MSKKSTTAKVKTKASFGPDLNHLETIVAFLSKKKISEFEWEDKKAKFRIRLGGSVSNQATHEPILASSQDQGKSSSAQSPNALPKNRKQIVSPFVGVFYRSSKPGAEPYVKEGQAVKKGQPLCIVEAMKLMNEIESEWSGKIISILVENGQPVEYGEPLFIVET